jgi:hypothetical protein
MIGERGVQNTKCFRKHFEFVFLPSKDSELFCR